MVIVLTNVQNHFIFYNYTFTFSSIKITYKFYEKQFYYSLNNCYGATFTQY